MEELFHFLGQEFTLIKEQSTWQLTLKRSMINLADPEQLDLLASPAPQLLPQTYQVDEEVVTLTYAVPTLGRTFGELQTLPMSEQLRFSLNILELSQVTSYPFGLILHPANLFITKDLTLKLAYRSLLGVMVPVSFTPEDFLRQAKALIVSLFTREEFSSLYDGSLEVLKLPAFLEPVRAAQTLADLEAYLHTLYQEKVAEEAKTQSLVSKRRFAVYKYTTIWLAALAILLSVPLVYLVFFQSPFQAKMLQADKSFLKEDYTGLIDDMERVKLDKIPYTQKYELAYAYIQGLDFNADQREVVMNNITLKSDELYLDYWIQIGRGDHGDAVDTAKRLDDVDLILYALAEQITATRKDSHLSGKKRDEKLSRLQSEYDQYWEDRKDALSGKDDDGTATTSASSGSASEK